MNIQALLGIKQNLGIFRSNHPKLASSAREVLNKGFCEGQEIAIAVRYPDGTVIKSGITLQASDLPLFEGIKEGLK